MNFRFFNIDNAARKFVVISITLFAVFPVLAQQSAVKKQFSVTEHIQEGAPNNMGQIELQERGRKLREFINPYIEQAKVKWPFHVDLNERVLDFLPVGMSFEEAAVVLKSAGFLIAKRPIPLPPGDKDPSHEKFQYEFEAVMDFKIGWLRKINVDIMLTPDVPRLENVRIQSACMYIAVH